MEAVLSVAEAKKVFGTTQALDGAGLELNRGEWLALLGPNGAGRTTLVRALAGRVRLDFGRLTLLGNPLDDSPAATSRAPSSGSCHRRSPSILSSPSSAP
jgi:ABC-type multidrug transport system ATPase subunit